MRDRDLYRTFQELHRLCRNFWQSLSEFRKLYNSAVMVLVRTMTGLTPASQQGLEYCVPGVYAPCGTAISGALYHAPVKFRSDHDRMRSDSYSDACGKHDGASGGEIWIGSGVCVEMSAYQYTVLSDHNSDHDIIYMRVLCAGGTCPALTERSVDAGTRSAEQSGIRKEVKKTLPSTSFIEFTWGSRRKENS